MNGEKMIEKAEKILLKTKELEEEFNAESDNLTDTELVEITQVLSDALSDLACVCSNATSKILYRAENPEHLPDNSEDFHTTVKRMINIQKTTSRLMQADTVIPELEAYKLLTTETGKKREKYLIPNSEISTAEGYGLELVLKDQ